MKICRWLQALHINEKCVILIPEPLHFIIEINSLLLFIYKLYYETMYVHDNLQKNITVETYTLKRRQGGW